MVGKLPSSKLYKILASSHKLNVVVDDDDENEIGVYKTSKRLAQQTLKNT